ncbi:MAG TPA: magnesium/cobalt transporter CorA [Fimbriimonadaceae bacterium]|nr:magnesium/cobalt transporter CorA [Fimbriimonadaceae bacterium]
MRFTGEPRQCQKLDEESAIAAFAAKADLVWIDISAIEREPVKELLEQRFGFHRLEIEDALYSSERPTLRAQGDEAFLATPAVTRVEGAERFTQVGFFVGPTYLVTVAVGPTPILDHWFASCLAQPKLGQNVSYILHSLLDGIVDAYFPVLDGLSDDIEDLEDCIYEGGPVNVGEALALKKRLLEMRRRITPIRDVLNSLLRRDVTFLPEDSKPYFQDVYDHTLRISETADIERDILSAVLDAHLSVTSNRLNQVMRTLTVIATVLMSMALISGIYGMNFKYMPELEWRYGYAFALALMVLVGIAEVVVFRKIKWL